MLGCVSLLHSENVFFFYNLSDNDILSLRLDFKNKENRLSKKEEKKKTNTEVSFWLSHSSVSLPCKSRASFSRNPFLISIYNDQLHMENKCLKYA